MNNFIINIRPVMKKVQLCEALSSEDNQAIINFYLEVIAKNIPIEQKEFEGTFEEKRNYYIDQLDRAIKEHDVNYPLKLKVSGTKDASHYITLPLKLFGIIKDWYYLNGHEIN
jgi:hypothetical protein